jgi:hypothetical protein
MKPVKFRHSAGVNLKGLKVQYPKMRNRTQVIIHKFVCRLDISKLLLRLGCARCRGVTNRIKDPRMTNLSRCIDAKSRFEPAADTQYSGLHFHLV